MTLQTFEEKLKTALLATAPPLNQSYTQAAVLLAFVLKNQVPHLIFTRRTMTVATHKGQISFPGGVMDASDQSLTETAIREANEEIGLHPQNVRVAGYLDGMRTVTDFWITPVVAIVGEPFEYRPAITEVAEIFEVPLDELHHLENWELGEREYNGVRYQDCRFVYRHHSIWGATGKLTFALMNRLGKII
ncbi:MAG: CoA pyrophosphatase [Deltaproteobacteria bacterium]|nr:CoA pyrophosphatase [Deltaproteobacteria bacterium]